MDQNPILLVLLDLNKAYYTIERGRLLSTLEIYSTCPCMCRLLAVFWNQQEFVTHKNGYHVLHFKSTQGTTQGRLISPTLFNLIVNNVVRNWITMTVDDQLVTHEESVIAVGRCLVLFYAENDVVGSRDI